ncbi:MAG: hypothetical protein AAFU33_27745 [Bacteroidota bacterium]
MGAQHGSDLSISIGGGISGGLNLGKTASIGASLSVSYNWDLTHGGTSFSEDYAYTPANELDYVNIGMGNASTPPGYISPFSNDGSQSVDHSVLGRVSVIHSIKGKPINPEWYHQKKIYLDKTRF